MSPHNDLKLVTNGLTIDYAAQANMLQFPHTPHLKISIFRPCEMNEMLVVEVCEERLFNGM